MSAVVVSLPQTRRGRRSLDQEALYQRDLGRFATSILEIRSTLEFPVSSRGWCYILEEHGVTKGEFDKAQKLLNDCRKAGLLPLDICKEDDARALVGLQQHDVDGDDPEAFARGMAEAADYQISTAYSDAREQCAAYTPIGWNDGLDYAPVVMVEKIDLVSLFGPVCKRYRLPIANAKGWSDLHLRASIMEYFKEAEAEGRTPVLLYCGDHDPAGLLISENLLNQFAELERAVGWSPDRLIVDRFGLNAEFIQEHGLSWIENLETGGGKDLADPEHRLARADFVQQYIQKHGARKVEANVLVVRPEAGRQLIADAIAKYIPSDWPEQVEQRNRPHRIAAVEAFDRITEAS